ncbi:hypothetical protein NDU88_003820 [Pleurodeles waltl]|uniref:Uncharacterized protein n=1 Tax=Pleurodeles waltl TaxID=8319 RepID=A0AAV7PFP4_PLEWA|nr:hypothetical protein NDU88_003820 [Pleurodeles waltl]
MPRQHISTCMYTAQASPRGSPTSSHGCSPPLFPGVARSPTKGGVAYLCRSAAFSHRHCCISARQACPREVRHNPQGRAAPNCNTFAIHQKWQTEVLHNCMLPGLLTIATAFSCSKETTLKPSWQITPPCITKLESCDKDDDSGKGSAVFGLHRKWVN